MGGFLRGFARASAPASLRLAGDLIVGGNLTSTGRIRGPAGTAAEPGLQVGSAGHGVYQIAEGLTALAAGATAYLYGSAAQCVPNLPMAPEGSVTNKALEVSTPAAAQSITGVGVAFAPTRKRHQFTSTGNYTLTVAATIPDGVDGQELVLVNVGANTVTIQDQGTLAGSNLRLAAATLAIGPRDSVRLWFSAVVGDWIQDGPLMAVL